MLDFKSLKEFLHYDPCTGKFTRIFRSSGRIKIGDVSGTVCANGYLNTRVLGCKYKNHRLAWLYMTGDWPNGQVDHINGVRTDNRIDNLRVVSHQENAQNTRKARSDNKSSGLLGVSKNTNGWRARIMVNKKPIQIGTYNTPEEAHAAYIEAKRKMHVGCTI